jgi:hypothetical protein
MRGLLMGCPTVVISDGLELAVKFRRGRYSRHLSRLNFCYRQLRLQLRTDGFQVASSRLFVVLGSFFTESSGFFVESAHSSILTSRRLWSCF